MKTNDLRKKFLEFFKKKNHKVFPSDTLVPDDESVLFTSAGMNQFKPYFLGEKTDVKRACSVQKCLRTGDLEEVGRTNYHHTFFEMLGNFSFGDYFKKEAIEFAWEFLLKELNIKEENLWVSVYKDDVEAYDIWLKHIRLPQEKIVKLDEDKNFWPANAPSLGPNGPCGPCSEIFFDNGKSKGCGKKSCNPACDCGRFVEIWNLVFTQFNRVGENKLEPLPQKNIDTGMGLERMAAVLQQKESNFEIDIFSEIVLFAREQLGVTANDVLTKNLLYAIVDHIRAATFAIADGVHPSNEDRGYVIRKLIRIALWKMKMINKKSSHRLLHFPAIYAQQMGDFYPELREKQEMIAKVLDAEEKKFNSTLIEGEKHLAVIVEGLKKEGKKVINGQDVFRLYDTYGVPFELSREIAHSNSMSIDEEGFKAYLEKQKELSRKKSMFETSIFTRGELVLTEKTEFIGYDAQEVCANIVRIFSEDGEVKTLKEGETGMLVLDETPFYPESGGQLQDKGRIKTAHSEFIVEEVFKVNEAIVHRGKLLQGSLVKGAVTASIDKARRSALARAHTATHLLQAVLRSCFGAHIMQQGSLVDEDRLRFDFTHQKALSLQELEKVEAEVNTLIINNNEVSKHNLSFEQARKEGALAFFKDKYKDQVRVISIGDYSKELCGGTHLDKTGEISIFVIISESSISSGTRRIEALVGFKAYEYLKNIQNITRESATLLKCKPEEVTQSLRRLFDNIKEEKEKAISLEKAMIAAQSEDIMAAKKERNGINFIMHVFTGKDPSVILYLCDLLKQKTTSLFAFFISRSADKDIFVCYASDDIIKKGLSADVFVNRFKDVLNIRGGGRKNLVQGIIQGFTDNYRDKVNECFDQFVNK